MIPSHGNPQMRWTLYDGYLFKYCSVKYHTFHKVSEKTSQQTYSHKNTHFQMPPRAMKHQLTCPIEFTSGSLLIGRRGILVIPRNRLVSWTTFNLNATLCHLFGDNCLAYKLSDPTTELNSSKACVGKESNLSRSVR